MVTDILFFVVIFVSNIIQAITGFAGTMLAMPAAMLLIGLDNAKAILNVIAIIICTLVVIKDRAYINKKEVIKMTAFMIIGICIGMYLLKIIPTGILLQIYGVLITLIALKKLFIKKEVPLPNLVLIFIIILAGIIHGMFISGGSLLVVYAITVLKDKKEFRATLSLLWIFLNSILLITHINAGYFTQDVRFMTYIAVPIALLSIVIGNKIHHMINQNVFLKITYCLLLISGISLLI
ncbi:MAG: sulfite exporter TauE/SafE family protein [Spirochaetales bacterium]